MSIIPNHSPYLSVIQSVTPTQTGIKSRENLSTALFTGRFQSARLEHRAPADFPPVQSSPLSAPGRDAFINTFSPTHQQPEAVSATIRHKTHQCKGKMRMNGV
jgi:hypothetical protein